MQEVELTDSAPSSEKTFVACLATILELPLEDVPAPIAGEDVAGWRVMRCDILEDGVLRVGDVVRAD